MVDYAAACLSPLVWSAVRVNLVHGRTSLRYLTLLFAQHVHHLGVTTGESTSTNMARVTSVLFSHSRCELTLISIFV